MNQLMRYLLLVTCLLAACRSTPRDAERAAAESARLARFLSTAFEAELALDPERQGYLGIHDHNDVWTDPSDAHAWQVNELRRTLLENLRAGFDPDELDEEGRLNYRLFEYALERRLEGYRWRMHDYLISQMRGPHTRLPSFLMSVHQVESVKDAEAYVMRLDAMAPYFDVVVQALQKREALGVLPPRFVFPLALSACRNVLRGRPFDEEEGVQDCALLADFRAKVEALDVPPETRAGLLHAAEAALLESVGPAYTRLILALEDEQRRATTDDGAWKLPDGEAYYAYRLRRFTTTDLSADEIHELGLRAVTRIHAEMRAIQRQVGHEGELQEFFEELRTDPRFYYSDDEDGRAAYLARVEELLDAMRARLGDAFLTKPAAPLVVKAVEPYRSASAGKAFYQPGSPDGRRPGIYYVNLRHMGDMPSYQMEALAFHEGIPGHHLQNSIARELEDIPRFRRFGGYTAYGEGWGLYAERLPKELGFYEDPYSDFGRLAMELWRACRLVVDTGLHDRRWTREEAIRYLLENTPNPEGDCKKAVERYIVMPGQATAYEIGMWRILELRHEAEEALGPRFDLRAFHDVVLRSGPVPLEVLTEQVLTWVERFEPRS